jgi:hypothetical protein
MNYEMYLLAFLSSFFYIGLKSWQQGNISERKYCWILPTSLCMAVLEVYTVSLMSKQGLGVLVFVIGTGGGLGSICATYIHNRVTSEKE